jgi:hypothetical protein
MLGKIIALVVVIALSGCTQAAPREEVEISITASEVPINGNTQKLAKCDGDGLLEYTTGASEAGIVHVQIKDGNGFLIGGEELGAEESGSDSLRGAPGKWNMRVDLDRTFEGTFKFTLTC